MEWYEESCGRLYRLLSMLSVGEGWASMTSWFDSKVAHSRVKVGANYPIILLVVFLILSVLPLVFGHCGSVDHVSIFYSYICPLVLRG